MDPQERHKRWWYFAFRGMIAILFGMVAMAIPEMAAGLLINFLGFLLILVSSFILYDGILQPLFFWHKVILTFLGTLGILFGIFVLLSPIHRILAPLGLIAIGLIIVGVGDLVLEATAGGSDIHRWLLVVVGVVSLSFAVILLLNPFFTTSQVVQTLGIYKMIVGLLAIILAFLLQPRKV